ncbi:MAG: DUF1232 domain-containing protein [Deltaproteobacteria bacterium]|nr:DUF1232 domain-containing protein [Deltaproteobacteria bacterium]
MSPEDLEFARSLRGFVDGYEGPHERAVHRAPEVFDLFARLFSSDQLDRISRQMVNGVLAYFVAPGDAMPEDTLGPYGLLDDLYVAAHAFRTLRRELPAEALDAAWRGEGDLDEVMNMVFAESKAGVGKKGREALRLAGLTG